MKPDAIEPITALKRDAAGLIERAAETRTPIIITQNGRATAVLQDVVSFAEERRAFALLKLAIQGERDILAGRKHSYADYRRTMKATLARLRSPVSRHTVSLSSAALLDVVSILDYIAARHSVEDAGVVDVLIEQAIKSLGRFPDRGRAVPELASRGFDAYREIIAAPYRIVYRVSGRDVWIVAIVDGRRDLEELLHERARR